VKKLADAQQPEAAMAVAREVFRIWGENGRIESRYSQHMYEHHLPLMMPPLIEVCGKGALQMVIDLLRDAETIAGNSSYGHLSLRSIADSTTPVLDIFEALIVSVRKSAEILVKNGVVPMRDVIGMMSGVKPKVLDRISLYVLAQETSSAPELATAYLLDEELIEQTWCSDEYAALAIAWFPSLKPKEKTAILSIIDGVPDKYLEWWKAQFEHRNKRAATANDEQEFRTGAIAELIWKWRTALPPDRREMVEKSGDPDARRWPLPVPDEAPLVAADFSRMSVKQIIVFLNDWRPSAESRRQTVTALAQELFKAAVENPKGYAAAADQFISLKPVYVRRLLEAFQQSASNLNGFDWRMVLKLIAFTYTKSDEQIDPTTLSDGDDQSWSWARKAASKLLNTGLWLEGSGIPAKYAEKVRALVMTALEITPKAIDVDDFENKFERQTFYSAQESSRGLAIELCIRFVHWRDAGKSNGELPRAIITAQPEIAQALEAQLTDRTPDGRIPRAIMGRFLRLMFWCDEHWLRSQMTALFPMDDYILRSAAWRSHLMPDGGPIEQMMTELAQCYLEEGARLSHNTGTTEDNDQGRRHRYASYVMCLVLQGTGPGHVLEQFLANASPDIRRQAMWFTGTQISRPLSEVPED
jgi:hypothetical protein